MVGVNVKQAVIPVRVAANSGGDSLVTKSIHFARNRITTVQAAYGRFAVSQPAGVHLDFIAEHDGNGPRRRGKGLAVVETAAVKVGQESIKNHNHPTVACLKARVHCLECDEALALEPMCIPAYLIPAVYKLRRPIRSPVPKTIVIAKIKTKLISFTPVSRVDRLGLLGS
jgi:hypothetical protein